MILGDKLPTGTRRSLPPGDAADRHPSLLRAFSYREMGRLALPATFASVSVPLVGIVNTAVIGALGDPNLISGVAIATIIFNVVFFALNFFRGATVGLTAQAVGRGDVDEVKAVVLRGCALAGLCGVALLALGNSISLVGLAAMGATGEIGETAHQYFELRIYSAPFLLVHYVVLGWVLGRGKAILALFLEGMLNGLNAGLSIYFVAGLSLGVWGAALATVVSEIVVAATGFALVAGYIGRSGVLTSSLLDRNKIRRMLELNSDILIRSLTLFLVTALFTRQGATYGAVVLAANAILLNLFQFTSAFLDGISTAAEQMCGRAVGALDRRGFERSVAMALAASISLAVVLSALLLAFGPRLIALMTASIEVRTVGARYLPWACLAVLAVSVAFQMDGIFIGATWARDIRNMMLIAGLIYVCAAAILPRAAENHGLWAAYLTFQVSRSAAFYLRMRILTPATFREARA